MDNLGNCQQAWHQRFSSLIQCNDEHIELLSTQSKLVKVSAKQRILSPGAHCNDYLLMVEGSSRVQFMTEAGREGKWFCIASIQVMIVS